MNNAESITCCKKPVFFKSQRFRLFLSFWVFGALLSAVYGSYIYIFSEKICDEEVILMQEMQYCIEKLKTPDQARFFNSPPAKVYTGYSELPENLKSSVGKLTDGFHKINGCGPGNYLVAVKNVPDINKNIYIVHDESFFNSWQKKDPLLFNNLVHGFVFIIILGIGAGILTSHMLVSPLIRLADKVVSTGPENLPTDMSQDFRDDEVGILANALESSMKRIKAFIEREKEFTRNASHELRTPVTIIKGAAELMRQVPESSSQSVNKPLKRIERSVKDMETLIETFLWMSREETSVTEETAFVSNVIRASIEENQYLLEGKPVEVEYISDNNIKVKASEPVIKIAVTNLIRNAFQYTREGSIAICLRDNKFEISDTGTGIDEDILDKATIPHVRSESSKGFGIGLAIVKRLCDRFGWRLEIESSVKSGTRVCLIFQRS